MANTLSALTEQVEKLLGLLKQVDIYAGGGKGSGGSVMPNSLANVTSQAPSFFGTIARSMAGMGAVAGGVSQMMPDVAMTMTREASIYGAGVSSGGVMSRGALESTTRLGLGKFQNMPGATGIVSGILAGRSMVPGSAVFGRTVTEVGQAARYLNMNNAVAAGAFEGFTSGPTAGNMLRNFGVFTSNPMTGEVYSQNEIFQQLKGRFLGGRSTTVERTMESLRRGNLGSNIRNSGLSAEQQSILSSQFIANAMGVNLDFSDPKSVDKVEAMLKQKGYENPFLSSMALTSKDDQLMETATQPYLAGIKDATGALIALKDFTNDQLIPSFGQLKATLDMFAGNNSGIGAGAALVGGAAVGGALARGIGGNAKATYAAGKAGNAKVATKYGLKTGGLVGAALSIPGAVAGIANGTPGAGIGNAIGSIVGGIGGSILGTLVGGPGVGTLAGGVIGSTAGSAIGNFVGSMFDQSPKGAAGGGGNIDPGAQGNSWTGAYGEKRPYGVHEGVDVPLGIGTPIKAAMDGVVKFSGSGSGSMSRGLYIEINHGKGMVTLYAHLSKSFVSKGDTVSKGSLIGLSGNSGYSTGPHLHFGLYINGRHQNPNGLVGAVVQGGGALSAQRGEASSNNSSGSELTGSEISSGMTSTAASTNTFYSGIAGVTGGATSAKDILQSILGASNGSLGTVQATSSSTSLPEPIRAPSSSLMGGPTTTSGSESEPATAAGGGYEPGGLKDIDYMANSVNLTRKSPRNSNGLAANVTINLSIAQASESEAKKFVKIIKDMLEEEDMINRMGSK